MSIHTTLAVATEARPVVARCEGMRPEDIAGYEAHRSRKGGDVGHVDGGRSHLNRRLIGDADWATTATAEIAAMREENFCHEIEELKRRKRKNELLKRMTEGPKDPFRSGRHGPLREIILTAHQDWFAAAGPAGENMSALERRFEATAVKWLRDTFGEYVVHARADRDEAAYHIHAVILPRVETKVNGAERKMLQPSKFDVIRDHELSQDSAGRAMSGRKGGGRNRSAGSPRARRTSRHARARSCGARVR